MTDLFWTIILFLLVGLDCIVTIIIGIESNPLLCFFIKYIHASIGGIMFIKMMWSIPLILVVHYFKKSKLTVGLYIIAYIIGVLITIALC